MTKKRKSLGKTGEDLAMEYLKKSGCLILEQNYRVRMGEIDLIVKDSGTLVFVEVKTRSDSTYGSPFDAVTPAKQRQLSKVALFYLGRHDMLDRPARFDVVSVRVKKGVPPKLEIIKNAFELCYGI